MPTVAVETQINVPAEQCFDLARDIEVHCRTAAFSGERAVGGVTSGLIGLGDSVTFEGVHLGVRRRLTARVTEFDPPHRFVDEMTAGAFKSLRHIHEFMPADGGTLMRDTLTWTTPCGLVGRLVDYLVLIRHMRRFLQRRNANLKVLAEG